MYQEPRHPTAGTYTVPGRLARSSDEALPLPGVGMSKVHIALELEHARRRTAQRLRIIRGIPHLTQQQSQPITPHLPLDFPTLSPRGKTHTRRTILRIPDPRRVHKLLLARRMRADQRDQPGRLDGHVAEPRRQHRGAFIGLRQQARGRWDVAVQSTAEEAHARAQRAHDRRRHGAELDQVGDADARVFGFPISDGRDGPFKASVIAPFGFAWRQDDGAVRAAVRACLEGPAGCVVWDGRWLVREGCWFVGVLGK